MLEEAVMRTVVNRYAHYLDDNRLLARTIREITGPGSPDLAAARRRAQEDLETVKRTIANILDNVTPATRTYVDERITKFGAERDAIERRIDELDRMALSSAEIEGIVEETKTFVHELGFVLAKGPPEARIRAIRQCVERIRVGDVVGTASISLRVVPSSRVKSQSEGLTVELCGFSVLHAE